MLISFDIFDTAIFRDVYDPKDIFMLQGSTFYQKRIYAEQRAMSLAHFPTIKDIYRLLPGYNMQKEINDELEHCYANSKILDIYNSKENDYIFISDMYLPKEVLVKMLEKCGYKNPKVFVSCEYKANKASGSLFKRVQTELGRKIDLHYGDNYKADVLGAKLAGVNAIYLPKVQDKNLKLPIIKNSMLKKYIALLMDNENYTDVQRLVIKYAIILTVFTKWVLSNRKNPSQKIFFLSRDMYVPYLIAKDYLKEENIFYLHASRKSLGSIALRTKDKIILDKMNILYTKEQQQKILNSNDYTETINYLKSMHIHSGDFIVDIGYAGTIQKLIEIGLNTKLQGYYLQDYAVKFKDLKTTYFNQRRVLVCGAAAELIIGSAEHEVIGYKNSKVVFNPEPDGHEKYSEQFTKWMLEEVNNILKIHEKMPITVNDCEQIIVDTQANVEPGVLEFYNKKIFTNRKSIESLINFDRELIKKGKLSECYKMAYLKDLFKRMLREDKELYHLEKYLNM